MSTSSNQFYIAINTILATECGPSYHESSRSWRPVARKQTREFSEWLYSVIASMGAMSVGPSFESDEAITTEYLLYLPPDQVDSFQADGISMRLARGEIFEDAEGIKYVDSDSLTILEGEVLYNFYGRSHGETIGDLANDFLDRLKAFARASLRKMGCNTDEIDAIVASWLRCQETAPKAMTLDELRDRLFESLVCSGSVDAKPGWYIIESLLPSHRYSAPEFEVDGLNIFEIHQGVDGDDVTIPVVQRLVRARPHPLRLLKLDPEFDWVRTPEAGEIFVTERKTMWFDNSVPTWIEGEIATELLADRHGEIEWNVEDIVRDEVQRLLLQDAEEQDPKIFDDDDGDKASSLANEVIAETEVFSLWHHNIADLRKQLFSLVFSKE